MPRSVSATEAKTRFGAIVEWASEHGDDIIVESRGRPKVVIIPYKEYQNVVEFREQTWRREALGRLERLREAVSQRNRDLTEEQALALADRFAHDVVADMVREGDVRYQGQ